MTAAEGAGAEDRRGVDAAVLSTKRKKEVSNSSSSPKHLIYAEARRNRFTICCNEEIPNYF